MWGVWDVGSVGCRECGMWGVWDVGSVGCGEPTLRVTHRYRHAPQPHLIVIATCNKTGSRWIQAKSRHL